MRSRDWNTFFGNISMQARGPPPSAVQFIFSSRVLIRKGVKHSECICFYDLVGTCMRQVYVNNLSLSKIVKLQELST